MTEEIKKEATTETPKKKRTYTRRKKATTTSTKTTAKTSTRKRKPVAKPIIPIDPPFITTPIEEVKVEEIIEPKEGQTEDYSVENGKKLERLSHVVLFIVFVIAALTIVLCMH